MAYFIIDFATAFPKKPEPVAETRETKRDTRTDEEIKIAEQKKLAVEKQQAAYTRKIAEWKKTTESLLQAGHSIIIISNPPEDAQRVLAEMGLSEEELDDIEIQTELTPSEEKVEEEKIRTRVSTTPAAVPFYAEEVPLSLIQPYITDPTEALRVEFMDLADLIRIKMIPHDELVAMNLVESSLLLDTKPLDPVGLLQTPTIANRDLLALSAKANPNVIAALLNKMSEIKLEELLDKVALMDPSILVRIRTMNPTELMRVKSSADDVVDPFPNLTLAELMKIKMIEPIRLLQTTNRRQLASIPEKPLEDLAARLKAINSVQLRDRLKQMDPAEIARIRNMDVAELLLIKAKPVALPEIKLHQPEQKHPARKTEIVMRAAHATLREEVVLIGDQSFVAVAKQTHTDLVSAEAITPDTRDYLRAITTKGKQAALREAKQHREYGAGDQLVTPSLEQSQLSDSFDLDLEEKEKEPPKTLMQRLLSFFTGWFTHPVAKVETPSPVDEEQVRLLAEIDKAIEEEKKRIPQASGRVTLRGDEIVPIERAKLDEHKTPVAPKISQGKATTTSLRQVFGATEPPEFHRTEFKEIKIPMTPLQEPKSLREILEAQGLGLSPESEWGQPLAAPAFVLSDETQLRIRRMAHQANRLVETAERRLKSENLNTARRDALDFYLDPYRQLAKLGIALTTPEAKEALKTAIEQGHFKDMFIEVPDPKEPNQTIVYTVENFDQIPPEALFKFFNEFVTKLLENYDACERFLADHLKFQMDPQKYGKEVLLPSLQDVSAISPQVQYTFALSTEPNVTQQDLEDFVREASFRKHRDQRVKDLDDQIGKLKLEGKSTPANQSAIAALRVERDRLAGVKNFAGLKDLIRTDNARLGYVGSFFHLLRATPLERISQQVEYDVHAASKMAQRSFSAPATEIDEARRTRTKQRG